MSHAQQIHAALTPRNTPSLVEINDGPELMGGMAEMSERIRNRIEELGLSQRDAARAVGVSNQRFGNYVQGTRKPDIIVLPRIARALGVTTDWLLGVSEAGPVELAPVVQRLLELDGIPADRAGALASVVQEALRILSALPDEGDAALRSRMAAQAAWQSRGATKPR